MTSIGQCRDRMRLAGAIAALGFPDAPLLAFAAAFVAVVLIGARWRRRNAAARRRRRAAPASPAPLNPATPFGEEVNLPERTIVFLKGQGTWDKAFERWSSFKSLNQYLDRQGIKPNGPAMTIYTETNDTGFQFPRRAADRRGAEKSAEGRHRGRQGAVRQGAQIRPSRLIRRDGHHLRSDHQLPRRQALEAKEMFIEEYDSDPTSNPRQARRQRFRADEMTLPEQMPTKRRASLSSRTKPLWRCSSRTR